MAALLFIRGGMINIIGMGKGKELSKGVPGERWGLTRIIFEMPVDVVFSIHKDNVPPMDAIKKKCKETKTRLYTCKNFPLKKIVQEFKTAYFTSSIAYALALAISKCPVVINLFGITLVQKNLLEYREQKPCVDFWVGMAMGRGIEVNIHGKTSEVLKTKSRLLYGYNIKQSEVENVFSS